MALPVGSLVEGLLTWSPIAARVLFASVWQGLLLTGAAALVLQLLREISPARRAAVWTAVLVAVLMLPIVAGLRPRGFVVRHAEVHVATVWTVALAAVWLTLGVWRGLKLGIGAVRLARLAHRAVQIPAEGALEALLAGGRRPASLCVSNEVNRPSVVGFFKPKVLLPAGLLQALSAAELEHVVLHEMEHLRRGDDWWNLLQQLSLVVLPLHPALFWLDRRLCRERELACDDGVMEATRARKAYAACLVKLAEDSMLRKGWALALSALGTRARESELVGRVRRILAGPQAARNRRQRGLALAGTALVTMGAAALAAAGPQWISFEPQGSNLIAANASAAVSPATMLTEPGPAVAGGMVPARSAVMEGQGGYRAVLTSAVVTGGSKAAVAGSSRRGKLHSVDAVARLRRSADRTRPAVARTGAMRTGAFRAGMTRVSTDELAYRAVTTREVNAYALGAQHAAPGRMVMTEMELSQPLYAAVPWPGGWLLVQL